VTRLAVAAPSKDALDALTALLSDDPHLTVVERGTGLEDLLTPHVAARVDVMLVAIDDVAPLRTALTSLEDHVPLPPVVVLWNPQRSDAVHALLRLGVRALLPRNAGARELIAALEGTNAGLVSLSPEVLESLVSPNLRQPVRAAAPGHGATPLSPREREILGLVAEGLGNKIVASRLGISEHTVKTHIASIFTKLGADTRAEAVAIGARHGMILL
jgi:DNA-binding NarL/FixJ family response regulator